MLKVSAHRILVIAAGMALALSFSRDARAATVLYRTDAQLVAVSERVVHGRVLDVRMERATGGRRPFTRLHVLLCWRTSRAAATP